MPDEPRIATATHPAEDAATTGDAFRPDAPAQAPTPPSAASAFAKWPWRYAAGLAAIAVAAAALYYFQPWAAKGLPVTVETAAIAPLMRVLAVNGRIAPLHLVEIKPAIGGQVTAILVEEGDVVAKGDILAEVDSLGQRALVRQALAGLDAGLVAQAQAEANFARAEALGGNIARKALDDARTARRTAYQEVARLTALLDQAQITLTKYTVASPIAGTVLTRDAEIGQTVDTTKALFSLADLGQLVVETDVDEGYASKISVGLPAVLQLKGETARLDGRVSFVAAQVDAATGGLAVKIAFDVPVTAPVGLTVTANIIVETKDRAIAVPRASVVSEATGTSVFVVAAGHALRREVAVVDWPADRVEVTRGLAAGEVIIADATGLSDGLAITVTQP